MKDSIVCSTKCREIRLKILSLCSNYFPATGCDNCLGDLHQGCSDSCREESRAEHAFSKDLWALIRIAYPASNIDRA